MASPPRRSPASGSTPGFDVPTSSQTLPGEGDTSGFDAPPDSEEGAAEGPPHAAAPLSGSDAELHSLKQDLERLIFSRPVGASAAAFAAGEPPEGLDLITGVGIGAAHRDFESVGPDGPGVAVLNVYVAEPVDTDKVKALLVDGFGVQALASDRRPVNVIVSGIIDSQPHRHRQRPAPCGISAGHFRITAGTLGALARGRTGVRQNRLLVLSNNHVLANSNAAAVGDTILQPGPADGGQNPADRIAILEQWVPLNFAASGVNLVDCATGWAYPDRVRNDFIYRSGTNWAYFRVGSVPVPPTVGQGVGKSGRTTQLTSGRIIDVNASIRVNYGASGVANFRDQITIRGNNGDFSQGGDSGSLIWTWDARRAPVGLLFAGGNGLTFANKIGHVLTSLDITLHT